MASRRGGAAKLAVQEAAEDVDVERTHLEVEADSGDSEGGVLGDGKVEEEPAGIEFLIVDYDESVHRSDLQKLHVRCWTRLNIPATHCSHVS